MKHAGTEESKRGLFFTHSMIILVWRNATSCLSLQLIFLCHFKLVELEQMQLVDFFLIFIYQNLRKNSSAADAEIMDAAL